MNKFQKLSRVEMKNVLGGNPPGGGCTGIDTCDCDECVNDSNCTDPQWPVCHTANCYDEDGPATYTFCGIAA